MRKRLSTISGVSAALVALALGDSAIAAATQGTPIVSKKHAAKHAVRKSVAREKTGGPDTDSIQSGDQTSPDRHGAKASSVSTSETPSTSEASETGSATENASPSDGPGGHEDPASNVDFQSEAQE